MTNPHEICQKVEAELASLIEWRESNPPLSSFSDFVEATARAEDILKYGQLLYPTYIKVEGAIVRADHCESDNWRQWREKLDPFDAAAMVNHVHVTDLLYADFERASQLKDSLGSMLAFYWQLAVDRQFPDDAVQVEYNKDVIDTFQRRDETGDATQQAAASVGASPHR